MTVRRHNAITATSRRFLGRIVHDITSPDGHHGIAAKAADGWLLYESDSRLGLDRSFCGPFPTLGVALKSVEININARKSREQEAA